MVIPACYLLQDLKNKPSNTNLFYIFIQITQRIRPLHALNQRNATIYASYSITQPDFMFHTQLTASD